MVNRFLAANLAALVALAASGCMSTTIVFSENWQRDSKPAYEDYFDSYLLGFAGPTPSVTVAKVCMDQKPTAIKRVQTVEDVLLTAITLGIYLPTTVRIWCAD